MKESDLGRAQYAIKEPDVVDRSVEEAGLFAEVLSDEEGQVVRDDRRGSPPFLGGLEAAIDEEGPAGCVDREDQAVPLTIVQRAGAEGRVVVAVHVVVADHVLPASHDVPRPYKAVGAHRHLIAVPAGSLVLADETSGTGCRLEPHRDGERQRVE